MSTIEIYLPNDAKNINIHVIRLVFNIVSFSTFVGCHCRKVNFIGYFPLIFLLFSVTFVDKQSGFVCPFFIYSYLFLCACHQNNDVKVMILSTNTHTLTLFEHNMLIGFVFYFYIGKIYSNRNNIEAC